MKKLQKEPNILETVRVFNDTFVSAVAPTVDRLLLDKYSWTRIFNSKIWQKCKETIQIADSLYFNSKDAIIAGIQDSEGTIYQ